MSSKSEPRVVLHPAQGSSIPRAFAALAGIRLDTPGADDVATALEEASILVSYPWRDEFLTPGLRWVQSVSAGTEQFPIERFRASPHYGTRLAELFARNLEAYRGRAEWVSRVV